MKKIILITLVIASISLTFISCKKDQRTPPNISLLSGSGLTSGDSSTASQGATLQFSVKGEKTEDELKTLNISYQYDGATSSTTKETITLAKSEYDGFTKSYSITTRNQAGVEKWIFTLTDRDGNISSKSIVISVN